MEIGVYTGYSLLSTALALPDDGKILALDINRENYEIGLPIIEKAGVAHKIDFREGHALPLLDQMVDDVNFHGSFDFIFVDADKDKYLNYHKRLIDLVKVGGVIGYDNTLWNGSLVAPPDAPLRKYVRYYRDFVLELNKALAVDTRVEICQLPVGDGITFPIHIQLKRKISMVMAIKVSEKIAQVGWFGRSYLTTVITVRAFIPSFQTTVNFRNPRFLLPRTRVVYRCCRAVSGVVVSENINLTDKEKQIFNQLVQVLRHFNLETQLRVAGGWVRDKLLGKECYDIDIAIDNMLGKEFCDKVNGYLASTGGKSQGIGVIQSNPDQSKHLETARMRLFDVWIDFVNLRSEDYAENSRIPTKEFGSAEQDAYRRDLTINSLFYNINTCLVEDFTGRGLDDLKSGKIVTPLPPKETFLDDPLRVLRAIRFSTMFDFEMVKELKVAAADNDVKSAIADKISRERIGHEINLMVSGNQPVKAIDYISELGLFQVVFTPPPNFELKISEHDKICVNYINAAWRLLGALGGCTFSDEQRRLYLYAALFFPIRKTVYGENKKKIISPVKHVFKKSLKLKASDAENIIKLHNAVDKFSSLIPFMISSEDMNPVEVDWKSDMIDAPDSSRLRILLGLILREIKDFWRAALMLTVEEEILKLGLEKVWEVKPLINGRDIMKLLELKNGGPVVSEWQQKLIQWQLAYPCGNVQECIDWMMMQTQLKHLTT
ncbi:hypothetical protein L1987_34307 [Smallanthus sonchifolius]|uniref:Uncharacterized protein n=1 Tax=Smallanthus sonchifolius TaxID=185202 RepID=A0ACB9HTB7_9ASTR|nr:hypothetical protein L1987_34307 [Smallanthus sonchifolius]